MKILNTQLRLESHKDSIDFYTSTEDYRKFYIRNFRGSAKLVMGAPKGYLIIESRPNLKVDKNILIIDVGVRFYNIEIICTSSEELHARANEIINAVKILCTEYAAIKSRENQIRKNKAENDKINTAKKSVNDFGKIQLPEMIESKLWEGISTIYPKTKDEYISDLVKLFDNKSIIFTSEYGKISFNKDFIEVVEALRSKIH